MPARKTVIDDCTQVPLGFIIKWAGLTVSVLALCFTVLAYQRQARATSPNTLTIEVADTRYLSQAAARTEYIGREEYEGRQKEMFDSLRAQLADLQAIARDNNKLLADHMNGTGGH